MLIGQQSVGRNYTTAVSETLSRVVQYPRLLHYSNVYWFLLSELYFLIAKFLEEGPCEKAAKVRCGNRL